MSLPCHTFHPRTYQVAEQDIQKKRSTVSEAPLAEQTASSEKKAGDREVSQGDDDGNDDTASAAGFSLKNSVHYEPFGVSTKDSDGIGALPSHDDADRPALGKFMKQKTSSELLSEMNENLQGDQEKIANFITQLKSGEVQTKQTSTFRARRLTYTQKTVDDPVHEAAGQAAAAAAGVGGEGATPVSPRNKKPAPAHSRHRTTIFAASEIGVIHEKKPPFPDEILGTYSCHGIEPSYEEEDGIHEKINQDRGCVVYPYNNSKKEALFIVLDGHGEQGDKVSEFVMRQVGFTDPSH